MPQDRAGMPLPIDIVYLHSSQACYECVSGWSRQSTIGERLLTVGVRFALILGVVCIGLIGTAGNF